MEKSRSVSTILVFFGLDPAPPSFRHARPRVRRPSGLDSSVLGPPTPLYLTYFGKALGRRNGGTFTLAVCEKKHAEIDGILVVVVVVVVDSHIQRIVLVTEETTVTQHVSHRPIKRQSRLWSQRGTKVNGSHHGDNPLLRPTGIQIATKSYAALQAMAPTNIKTVRQTSLLHSRATSIDSECCRLPTTSVLSKKPEKLRSNQF